jgi:hypothetical protein
MAGECKKKPNRTKKRYFTACDAARIAREVVEDDPTATPEEVLACIAKGFGFTHISLSRLRAVESGVNLDKKAILPLLLNLLKLIEKAREKAGILKDFLGPIFVILKKVVDLVKKIDTIEPPQREVDEVIDPQKCKCKDRFKQPENEVIKDGSKKGGVRRRT